MRVKVTVLEQTDVEKEAMQDEVNRRSRLAPAGTPSVTTELMLEAVVMEFVNPIISAWPQAKKDYIALMEAWTKMTLEQRRAFVAGLPAAA